MRVLAVGDVVGQAGCDFLRQKMPQLKEQYRPDFILVNGENSAEGNGILPFSAKQIFDCGADVITTGNHGLRRREINAVYYTNLDVYKRQVWDFGRRGV